MNKERFFSRVSQLLANIKKSKKVYVFLGSGAILIYLLVYSSFFSLGLSVDQFSLQFNNSMAKIGLEPRINQIPLEQDVVGSHFGFLINESTFIKGVKGVVNSAGNIRAVAFVVVNDGSVKGVGQMIVFLSGVIETVDPSLKTEDRFRLLKELELLSNKASGELVRNNLKYTFSKTEVKGAIIFYVMRAYDPLYDPIYNKFSIYPAKK